MKRSHRIFWIAAALFIMAVIFYFSSQSSIKSEALSDTVARTFRIRQKTKAVRVSNQPIFLGLTLRKLAHVVLFASLAFCLYHAYTKIRGQLFLTLGTAWLYGVLDELHQTLTHRYGRWQDTLIDLIGIVLGIAAAILAEYLRKRFFPDGIRIRKTET